MLTGCTTGETRWLYNPCVVVAPPSAGLAVSAPAGHTIPGYVKCESPRMLAFTGSTTLHKIDYAQITKFQNWCASACKALESRTKLNLRGLIQGADQRAFRRTPRIR